jgi:amino acid permease
MKYYAINKIDLYLRRHMLFASFICLIILIHVLTLPIHIDEFLDQVKESFFNVVASFFFLTILNAIPIFLFSFLLHISMNFQYSSEPNLTFRHTFYISLFSNFILIKGTGNIKTHNKLAYFI